MKNPEKPQMAILYQWAPSSEDTLEIREARGKAMVDFFLSSSSRSFTKDLDVSKGWSDFIRSITNSREWATFAYVSLLEGAFGLSTSRQVDGVEEAHNPTFSLPFYNQEVKQIQHLSLESLAKVYADVVAGDFPFEYLPDPLHRRLGILVLKKSETAWHFIALTALKEYQQGYRV